MFLKASRETRPSSTVDNELAKVEVKVIEQHVSPRKLALRMARKQ